MRPFVLRSSSASHPGPPEAGHGDASAVDAFRGVVARLLEATGGQALPDRSGALGQPFSTFPDLTSYERAVLRVG